MLFKWERLWGFFALVAALACLLYPNDYFLGQMHRQNPDRSVALNHLNDYLRERPFHRSATLSLAKAHEDIGDPESAAKVLRSLYEHRRADVDIARRYLRLLDEAGLFAEARDFRWRLYVDLKNKGGVDRYWLESLLYRNYQEALLLQDPALELQSLKALIESGKKPENYEWSLLSYHMTHRNHRESEKLLSERLARDSSDLEARMLLSDVYFAQRKNDEALEAVRVALLDNPGEPDLLRKRVEILLALGRHADSLPDLQALVRLAPGDRRLREELAYNTLKAGRVQEAVALYRAELNRRPKDRRAWLNLIDAMETQ